MVEFKLMKKKGIVERLKRRIDYVANETELEIIIHSIKNLEDEIKELQSVSN